MTRSKEIIYAVGLGIILYSLGIRRRGRRYRFVESDKTTNKIVTHPGYQIINCEYINIINENAAFKYAFDRGKISKSEEGLYNNLFNGIDCFNNLLLDETTSQFIYRLMISFLAGKVFVNTTSIEDAVIFIEKFKHRFILEPEPKFYILETINKYTNN